jgi:fucose 4-O-acetylase-like acetyltransferase
MNTRLKHIDIAKGIGILLVVFGHNAIIFNQKGELSNIIFSFHLPLFLFLSGLFWNTKNTLKELIVNKLDSMIKPYFTTLIIVYLCSKPDRFINYLAGVIYSTGATIPSAWVPLWFLTHIWAVTVFSWVFVKLTKINSLRIFLRVFVLLCLLIIGFLVNGFFWKRPMNLDWFIVKFYGNSSFLAGLPFSIDIIFISSFFFLMGCLLKQQVIDFKIKYHYLFLSLFLFSVCHYYFDYSINLNSRIYDNLIISTVEAISGIYIILCISCLISKYQIASEIFGYIGSGSLFILIFHGLFQYQALVFFSNYYNKNYVPEILSFIIGSSIPLLIWELVKRNDYLSLLFLPVKYNNLFKDKK